MAWLAPWSTVLPSLAAFAVFGASARACLLCFTSYEERLQICQIFAGLDSPDLGKCEEAFADAFKGLLDTEISEEIIPCSPASSRGGGAPGVGGGRDPRGLERLRGMRCRDGRMETWGAEIGDRGMTTSGMWCQGKQFSPSPCLPLPDYEERGQLHDAFTQMTHSLQEMATAQGSFRVAFLHAAEKMQKIILQLKEVQVCIPPCGLQEVTRRFRCRGCYSKVCDLPLDCPVQDLTVTRGRQAMFSCTVNFQLPKEEITYSWKFAGGRRDYLLRSGRGRPPSASIRFSPSVPQLRTQDPTYFRDIPRAQGYLARIRPVQPTHRGTFSCVITHDQRPLARLYFFLNVTGPPPRGETELQVSFREVLRWVPQEAEMIEPWRPSLGELLARPEALTPGNQCLLAALVALASASVTVLVWMFFRWYCSGN